MFNILYFFFSDKYPLTISITVHNYKSYKSLPGLATYFRFSFRFFKKGSCQLLAKVCARSTGQPLRRSKSAQEKCG